MGGAWSRILVGGLEELGRRRRTMEEITGTGKWVKRGVPHKGWVCVGVEDLGVPSRTCEMCEVMVIRYVHRMKHDDYPEELNCGCICAGHMEDDYINAQSRERWMHNVNSRRKNWLTRAWRVSRKGNSFLNTDGCNIVVFGFGSSWGYRIENEETETVTSGRNFRSEKAAKLGAFDGLVETKLKATLGRRST